MNTYSISVENIYTNDQRTFEQNSSSDVREVHKNALREITIEEEITSIQSGGRVVFNLKKGFTA